MMRGEVVERIGGFDPLFGTGNFEDDDYCLRAQLAGYKLVVADDVFVHHYGSQSFKREPEAYARLLETNKMLFAAKWEIDFVGNGYRLEQVLARGLEGVDPGDLYLPFQLEAIFSPEVLPLDIGCSAPTGILCVPDPSDCDRTWLELVRSYALSFRPGDGLALIIRVEPPSKEWTVRVVSSVQEMARREGIDLGRNDIVIEARKIPSSQRGRVYRAARFFVPLPGVRREALTREARRCGLSVVELQELASKRWCPPRLKRA